MHVDPDLLLALPVCVLSIVVHESAHGWAALRCGDPTARDLGRVTLNPLPHDRGVLAVLPRENIRLSTVVPHGPRYGAHFYRR